jgi:hypothetical protein
MGPKEPDFDYTMPSIPNIFRTPEGSDSEGSGSEELAIITPPGSRFPTFEEPIALAPESSTPATSPGQVPTQETAPPPTPYTTGSSNKRRPWVLPVVLLAVILIGAGAGFAYWSTQKGGEKDSPTTSQDPLATGDNPQAFISYAEKWTGTNPLDPINTSAGNPQVHLVGFTEAGQEIQIYRFANTRHTYRVSGSNIYVLECDYSTGAAQILALEYDSATSTYSAALKAELHICPSQFAVMAGKVYYLPEDFSTELVAIDLAPGGQTISINLDGSLCPVGSGDQSTIWNLRATTDTLIYQCNFGVGHVNGPLRSYDPISGVPAIIHEQGSLETVLSHEVLYSLENWSEMGTVEYASYDTASGESTALGDLSRTQRHFTDGTDYASGGAIVPIGDGYIYGSMWVDAQDSNMVELYHAVNASSPQHLVQIQIDPYVYNMVVLPTSSTTFLVSTTTWNSEGDLSGGWLKTYNLRGELMNSSSALANSPDQITYVNVQYPRFSA